MVEKGSSLNARYAESSWVVDTDKAGGIRALIKARSLAREVLDKSILYADDRIFTVAYRAYFTEALAFSILYGRDELEKLLCLSTS